MPKYRISWINEKRTKTKTLNIIQTSTFFARVSYCSLRTHSFSDRLQMRMPVVPTTDVKFSTINYHKTKSDYALISQGCQQPHEHVLKPKKRQNRTVLFAYTFDNGKQTTCLLMVFFFNQDIRIRKHGIKPSYTGN